MNLTLNIDVSEETREAVEKIRDLNERVAWFLQEQAALERWRQERQSNDDREIAAAIVREAEFLKQSGESRDAIGERFLSRWDRMMSQIAE
ncbi:MAG: hypothetical protein JNJ70_26285 [Verrucomicrobiales bacterium]|nr:hypothetical protein [Verrucomicrobiales bacterium]